jgi:hypothetical protein|tara:strand:- start:993 stop:1199 length:207 start_codon:yes stop_codon:yes gene_type:complete
VQAGDLVKITRASLGVAYGRLGLIVKEYDPRAGARSLRSDQMIYVVKLVGSPSIPERRYLARDLEVIK